MSDVGFLKLMIMIEHIKMTQIPYFDIWLMFLSGQVSHVSNSGNLIWNLKHPVPVQKRLFL